jgi:hypothetical protein
MNVYGILTRYGHYFEVTAHDEDHAREEAEKEIANGECPEITDTVEQIDELPGLGTLIANIRSDLAEIVAS